MFGKRYELFKLFGFSVKVDLSWLFIFALLTWSLATGLFPKFYEGFSPGTYWGMGFAGALGLFASVVAHELSHSLVARRYGMEMRGITLFIFGGVAEMDEEPPSPRGEFMMAAAGPLASLVVAAIAYGVYWVGELATWPVAATAVFWYLALINVVLAIFNLIPAFPLDGGRLARAVLWHFKGNLKWATRKTATAGNVFGIVLIVLGLLSVISGNFVGGMWWFLLGLFVRFAAEGSYRQLVVRQLLGGEPVKNVMQTDVKSVPPSATIDQLVEEYVYKHHYKMFPVAENGDLRGCVTTRQIKEVPREQWNERTVGEVARPCSEKNSIAADTDAMVALKRMNREGSSRLMVTEGDQLRGIVALKDLSRLISLKLELEEA